MSTKSRLRSLVQRPVPRWRWAVWILLFVAAATAGLTFRARMNRFAQAGSADRALTGRAEGGTLLIAGGGQLPQQIRSRFVQLAGGKTARIVVIPALAVDEDERQRELGRWHDHGAADVVVLHTMSRDEADDVGFSIAIDKATAVWFGGGSQSSLKTWYGGTRVESRVRALLDRGGVVGGTSAGAAILSELMIAGGRATPKLTDGFGFWPGVVVDQHFLRRNRWSRLQAALASRPGLTGVGVDEDTALIVERTTGRMAVIGNSYVVVCVPAADDRLPRVEFLKAGDEASLSGLRNGEPLGLNPTELESLLIGE